MLSLVIFAFISVSAAETFLNPITPIAYTTYYKDRPSYEYSSNVQAPSYNYQSYVRSGDYDRKFVAVAPAAIPIAAAPAAIPVAAAPAPAVIAAKTFAAAPASFFATRAYAAPLPVAAAPVLATRTFAAAPAVIAAKAAPAPLAIASSAPTFFAQPALRTYYAQPAPAATFYAQPAPAATFYAQPAPAATFYAAPAFRYASAAPAFVAAPAKLEPVPQPEAKFVSYAPFAAQRAVYVENPAPLAVQPALRFAQPAYVPTFKATPAKIVDTVQEYKVADGFAETKSQYHTQNELGEATYGHNEPNQSHAAVQDAEGNKAGSFSYIGADGRLLTTNYIADQGGYRVATNALPKTDEPAAPAAATIIAN